jgi:hypothetical protein
MPPLTVAPCLPGPSGSVLLVMEPVAAFWPRRLVWPAAGWWTVRGPPKEPAERLWSWDDTSGRNGISLTPAGKSMAWPNIAAWFADSVKTGRTAAAAEAGVACFAARAAADLGSGGHATCARCKTAPMGWDATKLSRWRPGTAWLDSSNGTCSKAVGIRKTWPTAAICRPVDIELLVAPRLSVAFGSRTCAGVARSDGGSLLKSCWRLMPSSCM